VAEVHLEHVDKIYPNGFAAVSDLSLDIAEGEFLVMVGPSGCGKSTTLRMIAGLEDVTNGKLMIGGQVVNDVAPKDRDIAMVFQNYALYPHMTVAENIGFALKLAKVPKAEIDRRVADTARILELTENLKRKPAQLSGGQRQRVAMGRAIVRQPKVFLLDEPLSNLDAKLRVQMRAEITELQRSVGVTTFYVTHDQVEAMTMADRVAVIKAGVLQQVAAPQALYDEPDNLFVAAFIGSPSMNLVEGRIETAGDGHELVLGSVRLRLPSAVLDRNPALRGYIGRDLAIGLRPDEFEDAAIHTEAPSDQRLRATVTTVEALGFERIVHFAIGARPVIDEDALDLPADIDAASVVTTGGQARMTGRFDAHSRVQPGDEVEIAVNVGAAHFFDLQTRSAIRA
jgi:multiple sugar transport system ATP-binding protein